MAEFRWQRTQALLGGANAAAAWQAAAATAERLRALAEAGPVCPDGWLMRAEAESGLVADGPAADRAQWLARACASWGQVATRWSLPPFALPLQTATWDVAK